MTSMLSKLIRPVNVASKLRSNLSFDACRVNNALYIRQSQPSRFMATASNYHYHEKPQTHAHDKLWKAERYLSVALLGVLPAAVMMPHPMMDYAVATSLMVHVHWGIEAIVTDYIRPSIFGPTIPKISIALVYVLSSLALGGLFMLNYTDVGITQAVRMLAKV